MPSSNFSRVVPVLVIFIIIAVVAVAYFSVSKSNPLSSGGTTVSQQDAAKTALLNTAADNSVQMTVRGPIVSDEDFRSYKIQIMPGSRALVTSRGYLNSTINNISLVNSTQSYEQFVYALYVAGLVNGNELVGAANDTRGLCAAGYIYDFQVLVAGKSVKQLWTSSCSSVRGSLSANLGQLTNLFTAQIPEAESIIGRLWQ